MHNITLIPEIKTLNAKLVRSKASVEDSAKLLLTISALLISANGVLNIGVALNQSHTRVCVFKNCT